MAFNFSPKAVTNGLVLALDAGNVKSYPGSGTAWSDLTPNAYNGTLTNGPTFSSANGGSIVFDGVDDYSSHPSSLYVNTFTINAWVYKTSTGIQTIIAKGTSDFQLNFYLRINGLSGFRTSTLLYTELTIPDLSLNVWNNTVLVYDKVNLSYFLNGSYVNQIASSSDPISTTRDIVVGRLGDYNGQYWTGRVANTSIYNRALSAQEILQNYNALKGRFGLS